MAKKVAKRKTKSVIAERMAKAEQVKTSAPQPVAKQPTPDGLVQVGLLAPGTRFVQPELGIVGVLLHANECRAHVRLERGSAEVTIGDKSFIATKAKETDWSPAVLVQIHSEQGDTTMAKKITKAESKSSKVAVKCGCGCGEMTKPGSKYLQGHDARFHGRCRKLADGRLTMDELKKELGASGAYALADYEEGRKHFPSTPASNTKKKATKKRERHAANKAAKKAATATKKVVKKVVKKAATPVTAGN